MGTPDPQVPDVGDLIDRLADLISNAEARIAAAAEERASYLARAAAASADERVAAAQHTIDRQTELLAEVRRVADANLAARDRMIQERDEAISQRAAARESAEKTYKAYKIAMDQVGEAHVTIGRLTRERDEARAEVERLRAVAREYGDLRDAAAIEAECGSIPESEAIRRRADALIAADAWAALDQALTPILSSELAKQVDELDHEPVVSVVEVPPVGDILVLIRTGKRIGGLYYLDDEYIATVTCAYDGDDDDLYDSAISEADRLGWVVTGRRVISSDRWALQGAKHLDNQEEQ